MKKTNQPITNKDGKIITESWCRRCVKMLPAGNFYEAMDGGLVDTNGIMSICKDCVQDLYNQFFDETKTIEKAIHKMCITLNIKFSNEAASATGININTLLESGKKVTSIFGIYKSRLISVIKSMDKNTKEDLTYQDIGTIYIDKKIDIKEIPIPQDVVEFWGEDVEKNDVRFLEREYANFKQTHKADTYAEIVLLKEVCYTILRIKKLRANNDDTGDAVKELQALMKNLAISPNTSNAASSNKGAEVFGLWIQDIEREEPAQWLRDDPRGDMYRDVGNVEEYFEKFIVRPLKNFILQSKDFNIDEEEKEDDEVSLEFKDDVYKLIDDGEE